MFFYAGVLKTSRCREEQDHSGDYSFIWCHFRNYQTTAHIALCLCTVWQPVSEPHSTLGWTSGIDCYMEHKHWSMQWVRWAHSAVDYLAAAVGGDVVWGGEMFEVRVAGQSLEWEWEEMDSVPF